MANREDIYLYYDNRIEAAIRDYFTGNKRLTEALAFTIRNIPAGCKKILDLGCGIGWTSYEFAKHFPETKVSGFDISGQSVDFARSFFQRDNLEFVQGDISRLPELIQERFEIITMVDVFEHVEKSERNHFYHLIKMNIAENGKVLLTFPSIYHQNFLREHKPEELQPVDENILLDDLQQFSSAIGAGISYFMYRSIYQKDDYIHTILDKHIGKSDKSYKRSSRIKVNLDRQFDKYVRISRYRGNLYPEIIHRNKKFWLLRYIKNYFKNNIH